MKHIEGKHNVKRRYSRPDYYCALCGSPHDRAVSLGRSVGVTSPQWTPVLVGKVGGPCGNTVKNPFICSIGLGGPETEELWVVEGGGVKQLRVSP